MMYTILCILVSGLCGMGILSLIDATNHTDTPPQKPRILLPLLCGMAGGVLRMLMEHFG